EQRPVLGSPEAEKDDERFSDPYPKGGSPANPSGLTPKTYGLDDQGDFTGYYRQGSTVYDPFGNVVGSRSDVNGNTIYRNTDDSFTSAAAAPVYTVHGTPEGFSITTEDKDHSARASSTIFYGKDGQPYASAVTVDDTTYRYDRNGQLTQIDDRQPWQAVM